MQSLLEKVKSTKSASMVVAKASSEQKNLALKNMIAALREDEDYILAQNALDLEAGEKAGLSSALLDRLMLNHARIEGMLEGLNQMISLKDPVGEVLSMKKLENGLLVGKTRVPLGVVGIIYEARPNVTVDGASLCLKSGNAVVLRGGSEAINSNIALVKSLKKALKATNLPEDAINIIEDTSRETVNKFMRLDEYVDVLIPRGGPGLIKATMENSTIPVIQTGAGNCHIFVDADANLEMAREIVINAKTSRPGVCNAVETILVHKDIAPAFLPKAMEALKDKGVEVRGCEMAKNIVPEIEKASQEDWATEYLDYIIAVKVVDSIDEAIEHINKYGTMHSEAIITESYTNSQRFLSEVDAAAVYVNASTRFTDGFEFGLGAEIGISTQKMHARGPMGLEELTSTKYIIYGNGQIRT